MSTKKKKKRKSTRKVTKSAAKKVARTAKKAVRSAKKAVRSAKKAVRSGKAAVRTAQEAARAMAKKASAATTTPRSTTFSRPSTWTAMHDALHTADPALGRHMAKIGAYAMNRDQLSNLYEALAQSIVYQQLNGKAAATIFGRVKALGKDGKFPTPDEMLAFDDATLRGAGLSGAKMKAIRDLAAKSATLPSIEEAHAMPDEMLIERLTTVRGIGRWTVEMLLIFRLGRPDVLPATDYGVRQGFQRVFKTKELPTPTQVLDRGKRWAPYRTMASWYLWRALDA